MANIKSEYNYFIRDEHGQVVKVIHNNDTIRDKHHDMNSLSSSSSTSSSTSSSSSSSSAAVSAVSNSYIQQQQQQYLQQQHYQQQQQQQQQQQHMMYHQNHIDIKREPTASSSEYYDQHVQNSMNGNQHICGVRIQNSYSVKTEGNSTYTILSPQCGSSNSSSSGRQISTTSPNIHSTRSSSIKQEDIEKTHKYTQGHNNSNTNNINSNSQVIQTTSNSSSKSKPQTSTHSRVQSSISRRRKTDKVGKGLRHFSMKVCEKVKEKGSTTYNEVADELVAEEMQNQTYDDVANCDQKNIRRRVYDALNVLMAMNIISKDKKEIRWIGLPSNSVQVLHKDNEKESINLEKENQECRERIERKEKQLKELLVKHISFKNLIHRNQEAEKQGIIQAPSSSIQLPFIIINTHKVTKIDCSVSTDKSEYYFKFNDKFELHDDIEVLQRMGLSMGLNRGECTHEDIEKAKSLVSRNFENYIEHFGQSKTTTIVGDTEEWDSSSFFVDSIDTQSSDSRQIDQSSYFDDQDQSISDID